MVQQGVLEEGQWVWEGLVVEEGVVIWALLWIQGLGAPAAAVAADAEEVGC